MRHNTFQHQPSRNASAFTLIEIMIVVAILAIILAIAGPTWMRQREISQQRTCQENLAKIDGAKQQWAMETNQGNGATPGWDDLVQETGEGYLRRQPNCPAGGTYTLGVINADATCTITEPRDHNAKGDIAGQ